MAQERQFNSGNRSYSNDRRDNFDKPKKVYNGKLDIEWIISKDFDNSTIEWANHFGEYLSPIDKNDSEALTTSQIRKFFGEVKRIQADFTKYKNDVPLLSAKLAYAVGRQKGNGRIKKFYEEFNKCIMVINGEEKHFNNFVKLLESTVAFHKFHGGKD